MAAPPSESAVEFYVLKHGEMFGPFGKEELRQGLHDGELTVEDFVQIEGQPIWQPLGRILESAQGGMEAGEIRGAVAPDWDSILKWAWLRLRYNLDEQSLPAGAICLVVGSISLALSRWPFVFWLPWFGAAVVAAVALLRRKREGHGALLLVAVVCIPLLFIIFGPKNAREPLIASAPFLAETPPAPAGKTPADTKAPPIPAPAPEAKNSAAASPPPIPSPNPVARLEEPTVPLPSATSAPAPPEPAPMPPQNEPGAPAAAALSSNTLSAGASPPTPLTASVPGIPIHPPPSPAQPVQEIDFVSGHGDALVLVKGKEGSGSGFICRAGSRTLLFTNIHVVADIKQPSITRLDGVVVPPGVGELAAGRDIARFEIAQAPPHPLEILTDFDTKVRIGDEVVVLGNSGGGGVVPSLKGAVMGIGPDRIEVSAEFIPGNSGSPIVHVKSGKVIGIATYLTRRYDEFSHGSPRATPAPPANPNPGFMPSPRIAAKPDAPGAVVVRRFGYRLDNAQTWEAVNWTEFRQEAGMMRQISALTEDIFNFLDALRAKTEPRYSTDALRRSATEWLATMRNKQLSESDRLSATRGFLNALRTMVRSDVASTEPLLRHTYFRDELLDEREVRDRLYNAFNEQSAELASPVARKDTHGRKR